MTDNQNNVKIHNECDEARSLYDNLAVHPGLKVSRDEAGIFKLTASSKLPQKFTRALCRQPFSVWIVVLHLWKLFHELTMFPVLSMRRQHELMILTAFVEEHKSNLFAQSDFDGRWIEQHPFAFLQH